MLAGNFNALEIGGFIATPVLAFAGAWGGIRAKISAIEHRIADHSGADVREFTRVDADIREVRGDIQRMNERMDRMRDRENSGELDRKRSDVK